MSRQEEEGTIIFSKQSAFGVKLNTDGYGAFYELGKAKSVIKTNLYWLEIGERKSPKEEKHSYVYNSTFLGSPYIYGKINNLFFANLGIGQQHLIGGKGNKNGVAVSAIYGGGLSAGLLKPYYVKVFSANNQLKDIKYDTDSNKVQFLDITAVSGSSGFGKGFSEITFVPGLQARLALRFDYGRYNELLSALETGLNFSYYTKEMPIMANNPARKFFFNAYVSLVLGKRK